MRSPWDFRGTVLDLSRSSPSKVSRSTPNWEATSRRNPYSDALMEWSTCAKAIICESMLSFSSKDPIIQILASLYIYNSHPGILVHPLLARNFGPKKKRQRPKRCPDNFYPQ